MNEFYIIFIINSLHVKFVISLDSCFVHIFYLNNLSTNCKFVEPNNNNNNFTQQFFCIFNKNNQN
jgi:hypothetical protein